MAREADKNIAVTNNLRVDKEFVLGNKVMVGTVNAAREHFEAGVRDMAQAEAQCPAGCGGC